ncbi:MAG TPA: hypothetical protein VGH47_00110 [Xanthobacteraceae bacterium]|jgi:hypothetical protein
MNTPKQPHAYKVRLDRIIDALDRLTERDDMGVELRHELRRIRRLALPQARHRRPRPSEPPVIRVSVTVIPHQLQSLFNDLKKKVGDKEAERLVLEHQRIRGIAA